MSITSRILITLLAILSFGFWYFLDKISERVERQYLEASEEQMVETAHIVAGFVESQIADGALDPRQLKEVFEGVKRRQFEAKIYSVTKTSVASHIYLADSSGVIVYDSDGGKAEGRNYGELYRDVRLTLAGRYGARSTRTKEEDEGSSVMYVGAPVRHDGVIIGALSVSKPQASMFAFRDETRAYLKLVGWTTFLLAALAAVLLAGWFARPIFRLTNYARAVSAGERVPLPRSKSPEVRALGKAFEDMRRALEDRKYVEAYVQSLTHEMKSPIAAIRGAAELLEDDSMPADRRRRFLANIQSEAERLQRSIERLLALSAIESRHALEHPEIIPLAESVSKVVQEHQAAAQARGQKMRVETETRPEICGEPFLLETAIANLIQNAIEFTPEEGVIHVRVCPSSDPSWCRVVVEDSGPGIPDYAVARVFERFYSLPHPATGRKSSGLGLCFVREAAELHNGRAWIENREDQPGARAVLELPVC